MRELFTDSSNSLAHVVLGFAFESKGVLPFLFYQFVVARDQNSLVDTAEYLTGWLARTLVDQPNRVRVDGINR